jgi:ribonuclease HI
MATRKLKHYFQAHKVRVPTNQPLKEVLQSCRSTGRLGKWAAELSQYFIEFEKRTAIKSQVLADFIADWTPSENNEEQKEHQEWTIHCDWIIHCDGAWGCAGAGAAAVITSPSGIKMKYAARLEFQCTNNIAEYEAVLLGLRKARAMGIKKLVIKTDSQVVAGHIEKNYKARDKELAKYLQLIRDQEKHFEGFTIKNISRTNNEDADEIAKAAAQKIKLPQDVFYQVLTEPSIKAKQEEPKHIHIIESEDWRAPIIAFLKGYYEPENENDEVKMKHRTRNYKIINEQLYKQGICEPLLKCISSEEGKELLSEIHSGICGNHAGARTIVGKAFRQGLYWPTAQSDSKEIIKTCHNCQISANKTNAPATSLQVIEPTWPLARWGIDIIGKLPPTQGNYQYAIVAVEYFTKWIEAKPITNMSSFTMKKFLWQNIICRFGVPRHITVDNGTQFDSEDFRKYCLSLGIKLCFASVRHP